MVEIVTGSGLGLENSSAFVLGSRGRIGSSDFGRDGSNVVVNAANGDLVVSRQDEFLIGLGPDISIDRTYNSQAVSDGDNGDNWRMAVYRRLSNIPASYGAAGSSVTRTDWDGSQTVYTWDGTWNNNAGAYVATDGAGAYDTITQPGGVWTWTDGDSQVTDSYDGNGRLTATRDTDLNTVTYSYVSGTDLISQVVTKNVEPGSTDDETVSFTYSGTLLTQVATAKTDGSLTRVHYLYDGSNRLSSVTVDLSPNDGSTTDSNVYVTSYTYDGASQRLASISQQDGAQISFAYVEIDGAYRIASYTQTVLMGVSRTTSFDYSVAGQTGVVDPAGQRTVLSYDAKGQLTQIAYPQDLGTTASSVQFTYNGNGDVLTTTLAPGNVVNRTFDTHGNAVVETDSAGNRIERTFSLKNELLRETRFLAPDPDGAGSGQAATPVTERYAYDGESHLRFIVDADGGITENVYDTPGKLVSTRTYLAAAYNLSGLAATDTIAEGTLATYVSGLDKSGGTRSDFTHDFRGNVTSATSYARLLSSGGFDTSSDASVTTYVYDQSALLLSRHTNAGAASEAFLYDGLRRLTSATDFNGNVTRTYFYDSLGKTEIAHADGSSEISTYDKAGELISYSNAATGAAPADTSTTTYRYDALGQLRVVTDATGRSAYLLYDAVGRKVADVDADGSVVEYRYDAAGNLAGSTQWANRLTSTQLASLADFQSGGTGSGTSGSNLLSNGSFDQSGTYTATSTGRSNSTLPGWTKANSETFEQVASGQLGVTGTDGAYWLDLDSVPSSGYVIDTYNQILNGSFEDSGGYTDLGYGRSNTTLPYWDNQNGETFKQVNSGQFGVAASSGSYWLDLESVPGSGYITVGTNRLVNGSFDQSGTFTTTSYGRSNSNLSGWTKVNTGSFEQYASGQGGVTATNGAYWLDLDAGAVTTVGSNLLTNGSFDTSGSYSSLPEGRLDTTMPGWTDANSNSFEQVWSAQSGVGATNGSFWLDLDTGSGESAGSNLVNLAGWPGNPASLPSGNATVTGWQNPTANVTESQWASVPPPGGGSNVVAMRTGQTDSDASGGGNATNAVTIDATKEYQFTYYFRLTTVGVHDIAMGLTAHSPAYVLDATTGSASVAPYFFSLTAAQQTAVGMVQNKWYKVVGYVLPQGSANVTAGSLGGIYDAATGDRLGNAAVFRWNASRPDNNVYSLMANANGGSSILYSTDWLAPEIRQVTGTTTGAGNMDISQSVSGLTAGQTYQIKFDHANRTTAASGSFEVYWNGTLIATVSDTGTTMQTNTYLVTAASGSNVLRFKGIGTADTIGASLDNVGLYATSASGANMDIHQTVEDLDAGQVMLLSFDHANRTMGASGSFDVYWNGTLVASITDAGTTMQTSNYLLTALAGDNVLRFVGTGNVDSVGASLDNVRLFVTQPAPDGGSMDISQTVTLDAGQTYQLQFDHANRSTSAGGSFEVWWNDTLVATITDTGTTMQTSSYIVTASGGSNVLRFKGIGTPDGAGASLDNVRLFEAQPVPNGGNMDVSQTVSGLTAGQPLQLQFDHANRTTAASGSFEVWWNGTLVTTINDVGATMHTTTLQLTAVAGNNVLRFRGIGTVDAAGASIDNVRLLAVQSAGSPLGAKLADLRPSASADDIWAWNVYDAANRLVQTIDGTGATTVYRYDGASQLTSSTTFANRLSTTQLSALKAEAANPNYWLHAGDPTLWNAANLSGTSAGTIDGASAEQWAVIASGVWEGALDDAFAVAAGDTVTATISMKAVGSVSTNLFGIYLNSYGWGDNALSHATILSGPGTITQAAGGVWTITGLSTSEATRVSITRQIVAADTAEAILYVKDGSGSPTAGDATILAAPVVTVSHSSLYYLPAVDAANDRTVRNFYDDEGRLIGTLDGEGYLTRTIYDSAGRKAETVAYSGATATSYRASGTFAQLLGSITTDDSKDIRNWFLYDGRNLLAATIDGEGDLIRYHYTPLGTVDQMVGGQKLDPAALIATPPTLAGLPSAPAGTILSTTSYTRDLYGRVQTETVSLTGSTTATTATYVYDTMGRLVSTTTLVGAADTCVQTRRYDARGRLVGELDAVGNATLPSSPTQTQIDTAYAQYGIAYTYDAADRLISATTANGAKTLYYYDADGRLAYKVDPTGAVCEYVYDSFGRGTDTIEHAVRIASGTLSGMTGGDATPTIVSIVAAIACTSLDEAVHVDFNVDGTVRQATDALGNVTTYSYDAFGEVAASQVPTAGSATIETDRLYDRRGLLKSETVDPATKALVTSYGYDAFGRAVTLTNAAAKVTTSSYDRAGRLLAQSQSPDGGTTIYTTTSKYDARGNLVAVIDAAGNVTHYVYDKAGRRIATIDALGAVSTTSYDAEGRVLSTRDYATTISTGGLPYEVTESALSLPSTSSADRVTHFSYDKDGRLRFTIDALMHVVETAYDKVGNVVHTIAYDGTIAADGTGAYGESWVASQVAGLASAAGTRTTRAVFDADGRAAYLIDALGQVTWSSYDAKGRLIKQVQFAQLYTTSGDPSLATMDSWGASHTDAADRTTRAYYDRKGQLAFSIDALGFVTRVEYDKLGNVTRQTTYAAAYSASDSTTLAALTTAFASPTSSDRVTQFNYDTAGRLVETIDPENHHSVLTLDQLGRILTSTDASGTADASTTAYSYDDVGRVTSVTRGSGAAEASTTWFFHDALGRTVATVDGDKYLAVSTYDGVGNLTAQTRYASAITGSFTAATSLTALEALAGAVDVTTTRGYDAFGRLHSATDARGSVVTRDYDVLDDVATETAAMETGTSDDIVTSYSYDSFGNQVKVHDARGNDSYAYYDVLGRVTRQVDAEKYVTDTAYTRGGQVASTKRWANVAIGSFGIGAPPANPTADSLHDAVTTFTYDKRDELIAVQDAEGYTESYTLDAFGERTQVRSKLYVAGTFDTTVTYTYNKTGLVLSQTLPVTTKTGAGGTIAVVNSYQYDGRGNRIQMVEAAGAAEARTTNYAYDKLDRLITTTHDAVTVLATDLTSSTATPTETVKYDRRGNVIESTDAGGARTLSWYDDQGRVTDRVVQTDRVSGTDYGTLTHNSYDGDGNLVSVKIYGDSLALPANANGAAPSPVNGANFRLTGFGYDRANRRISTTVTGLLTGEYAGGAYGFSTGDVVTRLEYDAAGNIVHQEDGRGNDIYSWYDKLGRKLAQVDAENYLTTWSYDAEGNALSETRFATRLASVSPPPSSAPTIGTSADDRTTLFEYDRDGRRTKEQRLGVSYTSVAANGVATDTSGTSTVIYTYNGLGEVLTKTEANGDVASYSYDQAARLTLETDAAFTDYLGNSVTPRTAVTYDGLGDVLSSRLQAGASANDSNDRITTYSYGAGGRLASTTDADGFAHSYGYDAAGRVVRDSYARLRSDGSTVTEAQVTRYDLAGRAVIQSFARYNGSAWLFTDAAGIAYGAVRIHYDAYGEVDGRGLTAGPDVAAAYQESFAFDGAGRLWKSNTGDGVYRFYVYDKSGNQTLTLEQGTTDLSAMTLDTFVSTVGSTGTLSGAVRTIGVFDRRGQQVQTSQPDRQLDASTVSTLVVARSYNAFGEVASETDARSNVTDYGYNAMGRMTQKQSPTISWTDEHGAIASARPTENYGYDLSGRLVTVRDADNNLTTRLLLAGTGHGGDEGSVLKEFHPDGGMVENRYDVFGDQRATVSEMGNTETRDYDKLGQLVAQYHPVRATGSVGNATGTAVQLVDYFAYDGLGQRIQHWNSQLTSNKERTDYDAQGRVVSTVAFGGDTTSYAYAWDAATQTSGLGTFGGWTKTTTNSLSYAMTEKDDYFGRTVDEVDFGGHNYDFGFDLAGRLTARSNSAGESIAFSYYNTGLLSGQTGTQGVAAYGYDATGNRISETFSKSGLSVRNATATYDALGRMSSWTDAGVGGSIPASTSWEYDKAGNVRHVSTSYSSLDAQGAVSATGVSQDEWYLYDSMNRFVLTGGTLDGARGSGTIDQGNGGTLITYNADGTRKSAEYMAEVYGSHWEYLGPNGQLTVPDGSGTDGGSWQQTTFTFLGERREDYFYTADGYLAQTNRADAYTDPGAQPDPNDWAGPEPIFHDPPAAGQPLSITTLDAMGRTIAYHEYGSLNGYFDRSNIVYDTAGRETSETTTTWRQDTQGSPFQTYTTNISNTYVGSTNLIASQAQDTYKLVSGSQSDSAVPDTYQNYSYAWWDGALQATNGNDNDYQGGTPSIDWTTTYAYDSSGHVQSASIADGRPRTVSYLTDQNGMIVDRDEADSLSGGDPRSIRYFFGGVQQGLVSNNGTDNKNYVASIQERLVPLATSDQNGAFRNGSKTASPFADFDQSYQAINASDVPSTGGSYTVSDGDTLQTVAQNLWGDAQLWFLLAQANGLTGAEPLVAGQVLNVPNRVQNAHNSSNTFHPYNPNEALGDTSPTSIKPPKKAGKCAVVGQLLLVAIAVAVTIYTAGALSAAVGPILAGALGGAAGSVASQAVGNVVGLQHGFNFKAVALAAISGAIGGGITRIGDVALKAAVVAKAAGQAVSSFSKVGMFLAGSGILSGAARGLTSSILGQGIEVATGLQHRFSWGGVAGAALAGGIVGGFDQGGIGQVDWQHPSLGGVAESAAVATAGDLADAVARTVFDGTDFGDNVIAALPDAIGTTLGNLLAGKLSAAFGPAGAGGGQGDQGRTGDGQSSVGQTGGSQAAGEQPTNQQSSKSDIVLTGDAQAPRLNFGPTFDLPRLDLPELSTGDPVMDEFYRLRAVAAMAGAHADEVMRQEYFPAGSAPPPQDNANNAPAASQPPSPAVGSIPASNVFSNLHISWLVEHNDHPEDIQNWLSMRGLTSIAQHQEYANQTVAEAVYYGRYFDIERTVLPLADKLAQTDPGWAAQAQIYRQYVNERTQLANQETGRILFAGVGIGLSVGGGAAAVTVLLVGGASYSSVAAAWFGFDYGQAHVRGVLNGSFEAQGTIGGTALNPITDGHGEAVYGFISLAHAFGGVLSFRSPEVVPDVPPPSTVTTTIPPLDPEASFLPRITDASVGPAAGGGANGAADSVAVDAAAGGSARLRYMGGTPDKFSRTGADVVERMRGDGLIVGDGPLLRGNPNDLQLVTDNGLVRIDSTIDMAHQTDAVSWWNSTGRFYGARAPEVRQFMLDSDNYILQPSGINRSEGALLRQTYLPPEPPTFTRLKR